jgi:hypothetical protein
LLVAVRADARNVLLKEFDPSTAVEPDHPIWKRFNSIAGNDFAARKLFAEFITNPRRFKLLDDADREPDKVGDLYAAEVRDHYASVEARDPWSKPNGPKRPWADELVILYLGTFPGSTGKVPEDKRTEVHLFWSWDEALDSPAKPAIRRVFVTWLACRDNPEVVSDGYYRIRKSRITEALPLLRQVAGNDAAKPVQRAEAALIIGILGSRADLPLLRRVAESRSAAKPFQDWSVILKGGEELGRLWNDYRFGGKDDPKAWSEAWMKAEYCSGNRSIADCAWAAAVLLAGGKPEELGFLYPQTVVGEKTTAVFFGYLCSHGFPDAAARSAAHAKAIAFLDKQPKAETIPAPRPR